ncbi:hypothetical protein [Kribbella soli]|uniref:Uncharacterized protein n=1 Tax=Kribbella soli TaxID=1124743 RepID=A0A4V2LYA2_9ACTN|nr:hypothetical protein [Kribbella soli]TCC03606.1 hypothetical protein E0H45_31200 [Kribbella soli]
MSVTPERLAECGCGRPGKQPWQTRDALWSPASVVGWPLWVLLGVGSLLGGWTVFGVVLLAILGALIIGSLALQGVRGHRGWCWLFRGLWFGVAVAGLPLRVVGAFGF